MDSNRTQKEDASNPNCCQFERIIVFISVVSFVDQANLHCFLCFRTDVNLVPPFHGCLRSMMLLGSNLMFFVFP
jgi:hypothetical protein